MMTAKLTVAYLERTVPLWWSEVERLVSSRETGDPIWGNDKLC